MTANTILSSTTIPLDSYCHYKPHISNMQLSYSALLVAALSFDSALAQPANREKRRQDLTNRGWEETVNWNDKSHYAGVDFDKVKYGGAADSPAPVATTSAAPATEETTPPVVAAAGAVKGHPQHRHHHNHDPKPKGEDSSSDSTESKPSGSKSFGGRTEPKDNGNYDEYIGNVGVPYGSNMIMLDSPDDIKDYKYSNTFTNPTSEKVTVIMWNKSGKDGRPQSGMGLDPLMTFSLDPNESKAVAFDENTQAAFSQDCPRDPMKGNLPDCTWGEVDFGDLRNGAWSGYDRSSIPNGAGNTGLLTMSSEGAKTSSKEENSFTSAAQTNAGGALAPGPAHFKTLIGA